MAQIPYTPFPTAMPTTNAGDDLQRVQANPADFGGQIGLAAQRAGETLGQASNALSQSAIRVQQMANTTMAHEASMKMMADMGAASTQFYALQGKNAVAAYPTYQQHILQIRQQALASMPNPQAKEMLAGFGGYLTSRYLSGAARHSAQEQVRWDVESRTGAIDTATQQAVSTFLNDPTTLMALSNTVGNNAGQVAQIKGLDGDAAKAEVAAAKGTYWSRVIPSIAATDPARAEALFDRVRGQMDGESQTRLTKLLTTSSERANVAGVVHDVLGAVSPDAQTQGASVNATWQRMLLVEHGTGADGSALVSPAGAIGIAQLEPATAAAVAARHGVRYDPKLLSTDPSYNRTLGRLYFGDLVQQYGGDLTLAAAAYNAGPARVDAWVKQFGDPRTGAISDADFAAHIPINETRSYVERTANPGTVPLVGPGAGKTAPVPNDEALLDQARAAAEAKFPGRPDLQNQVVEQAEHQIAFRNALQARQQAEAARAKHEAQQQAWTTITDSLMSDPSHFDPSVIAHDPNLTGQQKLQLYGAAQRFLAQQSGHDAATYGRGFYALLQDVHAAPGDPNRITDPTQLWPHVGPNGDLTLAGAKELTAEIESRRTPEGQGEAAMLRQFLKMAHGQITHANDLLHMKDPKGEQEFEAFLTQFFPAYRAARANGESGADLFNPKSKDYLGKIIPSFVRPRAVWMKDMLHDNPIATAGASSGASTGGIDLKTPAGIVAAFHAGKINRAQALQLLTAGAPATAATPPLVPTDG